MAWRDLSDALESLLARGRAGSVLAAAAVSLVVSWILYVPIHELMHVAGCLLTGGTVTEVRLAPIHGGTILAAWTPIVTAAAGGYAGRITGFDTRGSDLCYLATDFAPYLLTILAGVPLLRSLPGRGRRSAGWLFGPAVVMALAPFLSLTGDYFEIGTVLTTATPWGRECRLLRSDDLLRLVAQTWSHEINPGPRDLIVVLLSLALALTLASWTYRAGAAWDAIVRRRSPRAAGAPAPPAP